MRRISTFLASLAVGVFALTNHASALTVNSFDCSGIDTSDGNVEDWANIDYLINTDDSVEGTTYYLDADTLEWETTEPSNWRFSMNSEQQGNIQEMKVCNTDVFLMMLRTEEPMMMFYDQENDTYVDFWSGEQYIGEPFTLPADYHYWMTWKMQDVAGEGNIIYFAADLRMDAGRELSFETDTVDRVPKLYLFEESDTDTTFEEATFDPTQDTELTTIEVSNDEESECDSEQEGEQEGCEPKDVDKSNYAFEIRQEIAELFQFADFAYGDTINMAAAMYNSDHFSSEATGEQLTLTVADETETNEYTFTKRAVRNVSAVSDTTTDSSIRLKWKKMPKARGYQIKLIDPETDEVIKTIKKVKGTRKTITGLDADTTYRAVVRAVLPPKNKKANFSAWSSGYKWSTDEAAQ